MKFFYHLKSGQLGLVFKWLKQDGCHLVLDHLKSGPVCPDFEFASLDRFDMNKIFYDPFINKTV
jgi:hypothetical protein